MQNEFLGRTVRLYLVDGTPTGIIAAEIINWTGQILVSPRSRLPELLQRPEASKAGVYFLVGEDDADPLRSRIYVGQSNDVGRRLTQHSRDEGKDFWNRICLVTSKDQNLTTTHVQYLESRLIEDARKSGRVNIANGNEPKFSNLPECDAADMEYFLRQIALVLPVLGFDFLKPKVQLSTQIFVSAGIEKPGTTNTAIELVLNSQKHGLKADAIYDDGEITVLAGSVALADGEFETNYARSMRQKLIEDGKLQRSNDGEFYTFTTDILFPAPSTAAAVIFDRNSNGRTAWRVKSTGQTLKDWQDAQLPIARTDGTADEI